MQALRDSDLASSVMAVAWLGAADRALHAPAGVSLPLHEVRYFDPARPDAAAWRFELKRGQRLRVAVTTQDAARVFAEVRRLAEKDGVPPALVAEASAPGEIVLDVRKAGAHVLRIQPELLAGGRVEVTASLEPSLAFPVEGKDASAVGSFFGDERDGGRRAHHGVDIFAPKGTPVLAPADGVVVDAGTNPLGGKVVWLFAPSRQLAFYHAHLDEQLVQAGDRVQAGDPLGRVGNTGNARTTPSHLHFGVFDGGPVDPLPFLKRGAAPRAVDAPLEVVGAWARVSARTATVRAEPSAKAATLVTARRGDALEVVGARGAWYGVRMLDGREGWIGRSQVERADDPMATRDADAALELLARPEAGAPAIGRVEAGASLAVLARVEGFERVAIGDGRRGWVRSARAETVMAGRAAESRG